MNATVSIENSTVVCEGCTCADVGDRGPELLKDACKQEKIKTQCCKLCGSSEWAAFAKSIVKPQFRQ